MGVIQKEALSCAERVQSFLELSQRETKWMGGDRLLPRPAAHASLRPLRLVNHRMPNTLPPVWDSDTLGLAYRARRYGTQR